MKCPKCQYENRKGAKFCKDCGVNLAQACSECGTVYEGDSRFCDECGLDLKTSSTAPAIDNSLPQSYTPSFLADKILTARSSIEGERKLVTVMFADVANYTAMAEKLDPEIVHQIMDGCFQILMAEIHKYEGTINQFTGDGVMALFGAPVSHEDHAQRACHVALAIQKSLSPYREKIRKDCGTDFQMRIGINSGPVIVGTIGDDLRMDYSAIGDTTNLAARMESMAPPGTIYVSKNIQKMAKDYFEFESLGKVEVKGKEELQEAFALIRTGKVETRIAASVATGLTRFVGRRNSMAVMLEAFDKSKSGTGQVLGLVGEAGVGKSRLLLELRNRLHQLDHIYLEGRCLQYGASMSYLPLLDILRTYYQIKDGDQKFVIKKKMAEKTLNLDKELISILPPFQDLLSLEVDDKNFSETKPKQKRQKIFEAFRNLLIRVSQEKPMILAIEDLHWIDKTSEEFIDYLIGWLANTPILLILLYRPEYTHSWGSKSYYTQVGVDQLGTHSSTELVKAILAKGAVAPELRQFILNRAAGNPLFMEEFTHSLMENGSIERRADAYVLGRKTSEIQIPDSIQGIISARIDRLEDNLKKTMQVAAVIGRDFAYRILHTITGMREELKSNLLNLQGLEFIYEKRLFPELEYIFKHALTQEVAYNSLLKKRRKEIHEKIGVTIEEIYQDRLEEFYELLAHHYSKSDEFSKASKYLKLSGIKANKNHSIREAYIYLQNALAFIKKTPMNDQHLHEQLDILNIMRTPMRILGYPGDSIRLLWEGIQISKKIGSQKIKAYFYHEIGVYYTTKHEDKLARKHLGNAFELSKKKNDIETMAPVSLELCWIYYKSGDYKRAIDIAKRVMLLLENSKKENYFFGSPLASYPSLCGLCGASMAHLGFFKKSEMYCKKSIQAAREINDLRTMAFSEAFYGWSCLCRGDGLGAQKSGQRSLGYFTKVGWILAIRMANTFLAEACYLLGDYETAKNYLNKGFNLHRKIGIEFFLSRQYLTLGKLRINSGDDRGAQDNLETALKLSRKNSESLIEGLSMIHLGRVLEKNDEKRKNLAEKSMRRGIKILENLGAKPYAAEGYFYLARLWADINQKDMALENLKIAEAMFREMGMNYWIAKAEKVWQGFEMPETE